MNYLNERIDETYTDLLILTFNQSTSTKISLLISYLCCLVGLGLHMCIE